MGEPVKIYDLAIKMVKLSGLKPFEDIDIKIIGLRPGEKLFEELLVDKDNGQITTANEKIYIEKLSCKKDMNIEIANILEIFETLDNLGVKQMVKEYVEGYDLKT